MAITTNFGHIVYSGKISTNDRWNTGVWFDGLVTTWTQAQLNTLCTNALADFNSTFWSNATSPWKAQVNSSGTLDQCNIYMYSPGETLVLQAVANITAVAGTSALIVPDTTAIVATLLTAKFGRSYRGRMYLPATGLGLNAGTGNASTLVQAHADHLAAHLGNLEGGVGGALLAPPVVFSKKTSNLTPVFSLKIDTKLDSQRGRKSKDVATSAFSHSVP